MIWVAADRPRISPWHLRSRCSLISAASCRKRLIWLGAQPRQRRHHQRGAHRLQHAAVTATRRRTRRGWPAARCARRWPRINNAYSRAPPPSRSWRS
jgi:hypothetical protein